MDRPRAFRHRERNRYGSRLEYETAGTRAAEPVDGYERFYSEVRQFLTQDGASQTLPYDRARS